jgi:hypothetical protein
LPTFAWPIIATVGSFEAITLANYNRGCLT